MAIVNFFAHLDHLPTQDTVDRYGPLDASATNPSNLDNPSTHYRVCSTFSGSATVAHPHPHAHAVVAGELIILEQANSVAHPDNSSRVNLILKPFSSKIAPGIPPVKYFIYRGILRSEYFSGEDIAPKDAENNAIIAEVHAIDEENENTDEATKFIAGFDALAAAADGDRLDEVFLNASYTPHYVEKGELVGRFDGDAAFQYSFEIVLDTREVSLSLKDARQDDHLVSLTGSTDYEREVERLEILNYVDPAAWFGMFARNKFGKVNNNKSADRSDDWQGSKLIDRLLTKFATKETVYLDLRDNEGLPLDLTEPAVFGNVKLTQDGTDPTGAGATAYRTTENWPIAILDSFSNAGTARKWTFCKLRLCLAKGGAEDLRPIFHNPYANFTANWPNFAVRRRFAYPETDGDWTRQIELALVAGDSSKKIASAYVRLDRSVVADKAHITSQLPTFSALAGAARTIRGPIRLSRPPASAAVTRTIGGATAQTFADLDPVGHYAFFEGAGYNARSGGAVDQAGEVFFSVKGVGRMEFGNFSNASNAAIKSSYADKVMAPDGLSASPSFFLAMREWSRYDPEHLDAHFHARAVKGVVNAHAIKLTETVNALEIRINDPQIFRGAEEWSPADTMYSAAMAPAEITTLGTLVNDGTKWDDPGWQRKQLVLDKGTVTELPNPADVTVRPYFKARFKVRGLKYDTETTTLKWGEEALAIDFYSLDGLNYATHQYADKVRTEGGLHLWSNKLVPDLSADPIYSSADHFDQEVSIPGDPPTEKTFPAFLTDVLNEVMAVDKRLVLGELRDYLLERDINYLSYELAFRLPFLTEDPNQDPYQNITIGTVEKANNPYIDYFYTPSQSSPPFDLPISELRELLNWQYSLADENALTTEATLTAIGTKLEASVSSVTIERYVKKFRRELNTKERVIYDFEVEAEKTDTWDDILGQIHPKGWFLYANRLRAASEADLKPLTFSGVTEETHGLDEWDLKRYEAVSANRQAEFLANQVPAYKAKAFNYENPKGVFNGRGKYPHLPLGENVTSTKVAYDLQHLLDAEVISEADKIALEAVALADFGYKEITNGTYTINEVEITLNGGYVFKDEDDAAFYICDFAINNTKDYASGVTVGFGYDVGQRTDYDEFLDYIDEEEFTGLSDTITRAAMGKKRFAAMAIYYPFHDVVWHDIELDYDTTIVKTGPLMDNEYIKPSFDNIFKQRMFWKTGWLRNNKFYCEAGGWRVTNEPETLYHLTHAYNSGKWRANLQSLSKSAATRTSFANYAKRMIHAFNTHDVRNLRRANLKSKISHRYFTSNKEDVHKMIHRPAALKHGRS